MTLAESRGDSDPTAARGGRSSYRERVVRWAILGLCLALSFQALGTVATWRSNRDELTRLLAESPRDDRDEVIRRVAYERSPHHAQLIAARSLVYDVLTLEGGDAARAASPAAERLGRARELALAVLREQPNSWQASMFVGAATYLEWSLAADRRLYTEAARWEEPLLRAVREARGKPEPRRFLATAYLETWAALSPEKKSQAHELLKKTFSEDPEAFDRLAPAWIEVAGDRAIEVMPDRPEAWAVLRRTYADAVDWRAFAEAHGHYLDSLERKLQADLDEAEERVRLGELRRSRTICLGVVAAAPRSARFAGQVTRALEIYPPGLHGLRLSHELREWLDWILEMSSVGVETFPARALGRLTDAIGDLEPPVAAHAALIAGDIYRMERYERLEDSKRGRVWAPFLVAKADWLIERGELAAAGRTLDQVFKPARLRADYWLVRERLARADADLVMLGEARERLAELRRRRWMLEDWQALGHHAKLVLYPDLEAGAEPGLLVEIVQAPQRGAVVEVFLDGEPVAVRPVAVGRSLALELPLEPKLHLLELRFLAGGQIYPGEVRLGS